MDQHRYNGAGLDFYRVPVTAETPPDESDIDRIVNIISSHNLTDTAIVLYNQSIIILIT